MGDITGVRGQNRLTIIAKIAVSGPRGQDGEPGFSPIVETAQIATGYRITITDMEGSQTIELHNGQDGHTPEKGVDYFTEEDVAEIAAAAAEQVEVPTKVSELENDAGYLTEHQSLAAYRTAEEQDEIDEGKQDAISDLDDIREGAALGKTALQAVPEEYAKKDDIPGKVSQLQNDSGYITGITDDDVVAALGYTPANDAMVQEIENLIPEQASTDNPLADIAALQNGLALKANDADVYHEWALSFDGTTITKDGEAVTFAQISEWVSDKTKFLYIVYGNRLFIPQYDDSTMVSFSCAYLDGNTPTVRRIRIMANGTITTATETMYTKAQVDGKLTAENVAYTDGETQTNVAAAISNLKEDKVGFEDYAGSEKAGAIRTGNGASVNAASGTIGCITRTYEAYAPTVPNYFVSKGTLENVWDARHVVLTQAEYDALATKDPKALYLIREEG